MKNLTIKRGCHDGFRKLLMTMKISFVLMLCSVMAFGVESYSQVTKFNLEMRQASVQEVIDAIESQSEFIFFYQDQSIDLDQVVSIAGDDLTVDQILDDLFAETGNTYKVIDRQVIIGKAKETKAEPGNSNQTEQVEAEAQQTKTVSGVVRNESGETLPNVTVMVKGTTTGVTTDFDGNYSIEVPESAETLMFSFVGMKPFEVVIGDQTNIDVVLEEEILGLEEVIAVGYGVQKKKDLTGAVSVVKTEEIMQTPTTNAMEAIQGIVPGMMISRTSGAAGASVDILIRGNRSINGSNAPLFVVDGVQGVNFEDINASDIESINVLKDASSTAIYGAQGANGVIIISTKQGLTGKAKVTYNGYRGINGFTKYPETRMGDDYVKLRREANRTAGIWESKADDDKIFADYELEAINNDEWTNWKDMVLRNGVLQNHVVSVSGGMDDLQTMLTVGYMNEEGPYSGDEMDKYTARLNVNYDIASWVKTGMNAQITHYNIDRRTDPISMCLYTSPFGEPYDENGNVNVYTIEGRSIISPIADEAESVTAVDNRLRTNTNLKGYIELTPIEGLSYRSNLSVALSNSRNGSYFSEESIAKMGSSSEATYRASNSRYLNFDNILTYSTSFGDHSLKVTGLTSYIKSISDYVEGSGLNQMLPYQLFYSLQGTEEGTKEVYSGYVEYSSFSVAGRLNYNYKGKYLLTATLRYDGASRLAEGNRWDYFPSVGAAWRVTEEDFLKDHNLISNLKLRASYGVAGNSAIEPYGTQTSMSLSSSFSLGNETAPYYSINTYGNPNLGWEKSKTTNIGVDFGILNNKVSLSADYYMTTTSDILLSRTLPWSNGGKNKNVFQNIGETKNKGLELSLRTINIDNEDFKWNTSLTFTKSSEHISKLIDEENVYWINGSHTSLIIGEPIYTFYDHVSEGIWQLGEEAEIAKFNENGHNYKPGDIKVKDMNNDYIIDGDNDRQPVGSETPAWEGGLNNTFKYKNFDLGIFVYARVGQEIWGEVLGRYNPNGLENGPAFIDYWTPENPSMQYPRPDANINGLYQYQHANVLFITNGSFVKLKNVSLGYTLPSRWLDKISINKVRVYATGSNIATWVKDDRLKNYDPERGGSESSPLTRQLIFGVNIDF
jgi:TonB-linked SusC/RagA family outer membrane protein